MELVKHSSQPEDEGGYRTIIPFASKAGFKLDYV
jgi:hypothetical protein